MNDKPLPRVVLRMTRDEAEQLFAKLGGKLRTIETKQGPVVTDENAMNPCPFREMLLAEISRDERWLVHRTEKTRDQLLVEAHERQRGINKIEARRRERSQAKPIPVNTGTSGADLLALIGSNLRVPVASAKVDQ